VDIAFDLCDRQLQHECRLLCLLIVDDSKDRQNEFGEAQITEVLRGSEFAVERLALVSSYGKTKVQHLETPCGCGFRHLQDRRSFSRCWSLVNRRGCFFRFSKTLFLELYIFRGDYRYE